LELRSTGINVVYSVREVHDLSDEVILGARTQIISGLSALASGIAFPPMMPSMGSISGTCRSEGITDIVMELITKGGSA
jgi:hypothetical protein